MTTTDARDLNEAASALVANGSINPRDTLRLAADGEAGWGVRLMDGRTIWVTNEPAA
jgi:hypothetical protein